MTVGAAIATAIVCRTWACHRDFSAWARPVADGRHRTSENRYCPRQAGSWRRVAGNRHEAGPFPTPKDANQDSSLRRSISRSEEHTSELQSLMRISYAVFCLKKKTKQRTTYTKYQVHPEHYAS